MFFHVFFRRTASYLEKLLDSLLINISIFQRSLDLEDISCYGFDMDYTLAEYLSPAVDELGHALARQHLVTQCGHDPELLELEFQEELATRGAWLDREAGNLLVVDSLGHILHCTHANK